MEKRKLEKLGIETSLLGYGCMRFPTTPEGRIDEPKAEALLDRAIAAGVNYIDTAYPYHNGESEPFVGKVLQKYDRDSFFLATKLPLWAVNSLEDAKRIFAEQLERLRTDHIDFYLLHALNKEKWELMKKLGVVDYCAQLKEEGKIRYYGFSFHDEYEVFEDILRYRDWDFCQIQYNYMDTQEQAGDRGYALAEQLGVPLVIMEPVKGGSLANFSDDINERFQAVEPEASIASWALRWVGSHPNVKVILSGMSTMGQVEDNLKTFADFRPLDEREQSVIADIVKELKSRVQNGCTACRYCMPCPAGVNIPGNFAAWNRFHIYGTYEHVKNAWEKDLKEEEKAKNCVRCGKCEKVCPQKLSIRADLARAQADLDQARAACRREA
ncbi:MAG: aldo/keto reductase [Eubacteriales bacterium]|nr:aldo/keto reductase [Eubacteriales bacterium]